MEIDGREAVRCCLSRDCLHASAIGLPTSCSPEHQLPKSVGLGVHPSKFSTLSECCFVIFKPLKKQLAIILCGRVFTLCPVNVNMLLSEPCAHSEKIVQSQTQVTYLSIQQPSCSRAGGFTHSLHHGAVNSFSYPVKGRVNPPSIWHAAHLAERHSGWLEGGESRGGGWGGGLRWGGGEGVLFGRCRPEQMDLSVA